jgi:LytS/YehU family sensor histidine kinase
VELEREVEFVESFVELEKIRHDANIRIGFNFQGTGRPLTIEPFLLLPLIENAFKHGIDDESGEGFVEIIIVAGDGELAMEVRNSVPEKSGEARNGVGLTNLRRRLELLYPEKYQLEVRGEERSYKAFLNLSLS